MTESSSNRSLTIFFLAVLMILTFFLLFAYFFLGQGPSSRLTAPGTSWKELSGDDDGFPGKIKKKNPIKVKVDMDRGLPSANRGKYIPQTLAERNYFSAIDKAHKRKSRVIKRSRSNEALLAFIESPLGQNLSATFELARRGQSQMAKKFINKLLDDLVDMDPNIQRFVMQSAMSIYYHDKDKAGLSKMLLRYLELSKEQGSKGTSNEQMDEWYGEIESKMGALGRGEMK